MCAARGAAQGYELIFNHYYRIGSREWERMSRLNFTTIICKVRTMQIMRKYRVQEEDN